MDHAPTRIRRVWEIVANPQLDTFHVPISSQLKGIEIELFPSLTERGIEPPLLVCIKNSILRDIRIDREKVDEKTWATRLRFSLGISWDSAVWKWGEDYVYMESYAKFSQSQSELFDENPADEVIATPEAERLRNVETEELARELGTRAPEATEPPGIDPLLVGARTNGHPRTRKKKALPLADGKGEKIGAQSHA